MTFQRWSTEAVLATQGNGASFVLFFSEIPKATTTRGALFGVCHLRFVGFLPEMKPLPFFPEIASQPAGWVERARDGGWSEVDVSELARLEVPIQAAVRNMRYRGLDQAASRGWGGVGVGEGWGGGGGG